MQHLVTWSEHAIQALGERHIDLEEFSKLWPSITSLVFGIFKFWGQIWREHVISFWMVPLLCRLVGLNFGRCRLDLDREACMGRSISVVWMLFRYYFFISDPIWCCLTCGKLPSSWVVLGSWSNVIFWLLSCKFSGGLIRWILLAMWFTWEGAPCLVGTRLVKLAGLSSKSTCNICCIWSSGCSFGCCILCPVCSISWLGSSWGV